MAPIFWSRAALLVAAGIALASGRVQKESRRGTSVVAVSARSFAWTARQRGRPQPDERHRAGMGKQGLPRRASEGFAMRCAARASCWCPAAGWRGRRRHRSSYSSASSLSGGRRRADRPSSSNRSSATSTSRAISSRSSSRPAASAPPGGSGRSKSRPGSMFLGSLALGNEEEARPYGDDLARRRRGVRAHRAVLGGWSSPSPRTAPSCKCSSSPRCPQPSLEHFRPGPARAHLVARGHRRASP